MTCRPTDPDFAAILAMDTDTIHALAAAFTPHARLTWLRSPHPGLGCAPIDALRAGRVSAVRHAAMDVAARCYPPSVPGDALPSAHPLVPAGAG